MSMTYAEHKDYVQAIASLGPLRWWERVFGPSANRLALNGPRARYDEAAAMGVPFCYYELWPAIFCFSGAGHPPKGMEPHTVDKLIMPELYAAKPGAIVPVWRSADRVFFYRVLGWSWSPGSDHIVSPQQFWLEYDHATLRALSAKEAGNG